MIVKSKDLETKYKIKNEFITYGIDKYQEDLFQEVSNTVGFNKPYGGLWASPINSDYGWIDWLKDEYNFVSDEYLNKYIRFSLNDNSKVMVIDSVKDLSLCSFIHSSGRIPKYGKVIDFECMSKKVSSILLTLNGLYSVKILVNEYPGLGAWDCESIIVINKEVIEQYNKFNSK